MRKRPFLDQQFKLYGEAVAVASRLANVAEQGQPSSGDLAEDLNRFRVLYWGPLAMVEDFMSRKRWFFSVAAWRTVKTVLETIVPKIKEASLTLAHRARESLEVQWGVQLTIEDNDLKRRDEHLTQLRKARPSGPATERIPFNSVSPTLNMSARHVAAVDHLPRRDAPREAGAIPLIVVALRCPRQRLLHPLRSAAHRTGRGRRSRPLPGRTLGSRAPRCAGLAPSPRSPAGSP